jgi:hypothetical protein
MNKRVNILLLLLYLMLIAVLLISFWEDGEEEIENAKKYTSLPMQSFNEQDIYHYLPLTHLFMKEKRTLPLYYL